MPVYPHNPRRQPTANLLVQACQHLWLVDSDDVYQQFTCVGHTLQPGALPASMLADNAFASRHRRGPKARLYCPGSFTPDRYQSHMCR
jgi:hypothetical protein